jgi:hypothetical protein
METRTARTRGTIWFAAYATAQFANSFRGAEKVIEPLVPYFANFSEDQATRLARIAVSNGQIWVSVQMWG